MSTKPTPDPLTIEQLQEVRAAITWGDSRKAAKEAVDDPGSLTARAFHRAATRLGITTQDYDGFLDQVTMTDLNAVLEDADIETPTNGGKA